MITRNYVSITQQTTVGEKKLIEEMLKKKYS